MGQHSSRSHLPTALITWHEISFDNVFARVFGAIRTSNKETLHLQKRPQWSTINRMTCGRRCCMQALAASNADMLVRIPLLLAFTLLASTLEAKKLNFGRLLVILASLLEAVVLLGLVVGVDGSSWLVPVRNVVFSFQTLTWCMIFAVAGCHRDVSVTPIRHH